MIELFISVASIAFGVYEWNENRKTKNVQKMYIQVMANKLDTILNYVSEGKLDVSSSVTDTGVNETIHVTVDQHDQPK